MDTKKPPHFQTKFRDFLYLELTLMIYIRILTTVSASF